MHTSKNLVQTLFVPDHNFQFLRLLPVDILHHLHRTVRNDAGEVSIVKFLTVLRNQRVFITEMKIQIYNKATNK